MLERTYKGLSSAAHFLTSPDYYSSWLGLIAKYLVWVMIGAAVMTGLYFAAPAIGITLAFGVASIAVGAVAGLGLGMFITAHREVWEQTENPIDPAENHPEGSDAQKAAVFGTVFKAIRTIVKAGLGLLFVSPLLLVAGVMNPYGVVAITQFCFCPVLAGILSIGINYSIYVFSHEQDPVAAHTRVAPGVSACGKQLWATMRAEKARQHGEYWGIKPGSLDTAGERPASEEGSSFTM